MTSSRDGGEAGRVFVDTGAWYDSFTMPEDGDQLSSRDRRLVEVLEAVSVDLVSSSYVFDEIVTVVGSRQDHQAAVEVGTLLRDPTIVRLEPVMATDEEDAWRLFQDRPDKTYSFTDCTSFVLMSRLGIEVAVTTDSDFEKEGFEDLLSG